MPSRRSWARAIGGGHVDEQRRRPVWASPRSLRLRALVVTLLVALVPLALIFAWGGIEAGILPAERFRRLALIVLSVALGLGWWLGWRMVRPIELLRDQALTQVAAISPGLRLDRADELGELAGALDRLLEEVRSRAEDKQAFVADLAHEFKSPVAAIQAAAESLSSGSFDAERSARLGQLLLDASRRLDALLLQFLELARAEAGMRGESREVVDVGHLSAAIAHAVQDDPRWPAIRVVYEGPTEAAVSGVAERIETAVLNLVENAASFARTSVAVRVKVQPMQIVVEVEDDGPGIAAGDLQHVFDRFYSRRSSGKGTGLGLALVRAIAIAHGGGIEVRSTPGHGSTFTLRLPDSRSPHRHGGGGGMGGNHSSRLGTYVCTLIEIGSTWSSCGEGSHIASSNRK
jgi:signal transduction histidine kinase